MYDNYNTQVTRIGGGAIEESFVMFTGHSDDLVHMTTKNDNFEFSVDDQAEFLVSAPGANMRLLVVAIYGPTGTWSFAPSLYEEGDVFPGWPMRQGSAHAYSTFLRLVVPPGTTVVRQRPKDEDDEKYTV